MSAAPHGSATGVGGHALISSFLNPRAREFVPQACRSPQKFCEDRYAAPGDSTLLPSSSVLGKSSAPRVQFQDLPDQVITVILGLLDVASVGSCLTVCKRTSGLILEAPLSVSVATSGLSEQASPLPELRGRLQSMCSCLPGIRELDLSTSPVGDADVLHALASLKRLQLLQLAGCKKVTRSLVSSAVSQGLLSQLSCLGLQRCFQLDVTVILQLLSAPAHPDTRLSVLLLSHIILLKWPTAGSCTSTWQLGRSPAAVSGSHQWHAADPAALKIAAGGPQPHLASRLRILALHNCQGMSPAALEVISAACPWLQLLLLGGCTFTANSSSEQSAEVVQSALVATATQLQHLAVLELSQTRSGLAAAVAKGLHRMGAATRVIDLFTTEGVQAMSALLRAGLGGLPEVQACFQLQGQLPRRQLEAAVEAAVNCSSPSRHTPLHLAAAHGRHADVKALLRMGARSDCGDRSGATPLFSACEFGHGECLNELLGAGSGLATVSKSNAAGESPLYIAALRGHEACVDRLLQHMLQHSLPWIDKELYGDCWTPLMAAAVADHCGIVVRLLRAAGPHARTIARQTNRNGSTAAHVAARRGCMPVLHELLAAAGGALASTRDHRCKTPIQVAEREGQWAAAAMLRAAVRVH